MLGGAMVIAVIVYLLPVAADRRGALLLSTLVSFGAVAVVRIAFDLIVDEAVFKRRVLVYGAGRRAASIVRLRRRSDRRGFMIVGYVMAEGDDLSALRDHERLVRSDQDLLSSARRSASTRSSSRWTIAAAAFPMDQLLECRLEGFEISRAGDLPRARDRQGPARHPQSELDDFRGRLPPGTRARHLRAAVRRRASFVMLASTAPVMLLTRIAIKLSDGLARADLLSAVRVGQYGKPFKLLKFRSMREDAERKARRSGRRRTTAAITRVGSFIRTTSHRRAAADSQRAARRDELRRAAPGAPGVRRAAQRTIPYYRERHSIKPGITGWAQLCYPYGSSEQDAIEKLQYDLYYVKNHSCCLLHRHTRADRRSDRLGKGAR
jgi:lipopolysaccharide/colanic/teichoic acid biosynthesis glycosyltransferase